MRPLRAGWLVDRLLGEPPERLHPVVWFGAAMRQVEQAGYRPDRRRGSRHAATGLALAIATGIAAERALGRRTATLLATATSIAGRMLAAEATAVLDAVEAGDLDGARRRVRSLVGRDPADLDGPGLVRATIESLAENAVDAVVAPILWATAGGAPAVLAHRAVNTLDAMVGHRGERYEHFGWASARLDDLAGWVPARVAVAGVIVVRPKRAAAIVRAVRLDAPAHPSPNAGPIEAAVAAALGVRLGGTNRYGGRVEHRGVLGEGPAPTVADGRRAVRLVDQLGALAAAVVLLADVARGGRRRPPTPGSRPLRVSRRLHGHR